MKLIVCGIHGRMGQMVAGCARSAGHEVIGGVDRSGGTHGNLQVATELVPQGADAVIDFSSADASMGFVRTCARAKVPVVVGSTGFSELQKKELRALGNEVAMVVAPNMSMGVNVMMAFASQMAARLGDAFDVEVLEVHHRNKKDSPSGTAQAMADGIAKATGRSAANMRFSRHGQLGERPAAEIGVQALRGGDVVGDHTVYFLGDGERIELTHRATSREQYAKGALRAAAWLQGRSPGLYDMRHVLGLV
jgi:4-hydroxy-tetrahydrodipicolinate reductase